MLVRFIKMNRNTLDTRLNSIQTSIAETQRIYSSAVQRTRGELVEAYLWWKDAVTDTDYLEALYEENEIKFESKNTNTPNFKALIQLVFEIYDLNEGNNYNRVRQWAKAVEALNNRYEEKFEYYKHRDNLHNELLGWINDNGGVSGITSNRQKQLDYIGLDDDEDDDSNTSTTTQSSTKPTQQPSQKVTAQKKQQRVASTVVQRKQAQTHTSDKEFTIGEVTTDDDELVVILAKKNADGTLVHIGDTTDEALVNTALELCTSLSVTSKNDVLRLIVECLKPHFIPLPFHQKKLRNKFFNTTLVRYEFENDEKPTRVTESVRLVITHNGDVLVSKNPTHSSLMTVSNPTTDVENDYCVFLRSKDRMWLEVEGEHNNVLATCDSVQDTYIEDTASHIKADKQVTILNEATQHSRNIYFYDYDLLDSKFTQPCYFGDISKHAVWKATVTQSWISQINNQHFKKWIQNTNKRIAIAENKHIELLVDKDGIEVNSYYDRNELEYRNSGDDYLTEWSDKGAVKLSKKSATHYHRISPLDIVQLMETLSTIQVKGDIILYGYENEDDDGGCIAIQYETDVATHTAYIPHCDLKGNRTVCDLFDTYEADYDY